MTTLQRRVSASRLKKKRGHAQKLERIRVSDSMHIYLITNKINGKQYVGKTVRKDPRPRWREHQKDSRKNSSTIISRAIHKHGIKNFTFQVIETVNDPVLLAERESFYIREYQTLTPKGYNIVLHQPYFVLPQESRDRQSSKNQGVTRSSDKTSSYLGVYRRPSGWGIEIQKNRQSYYLTVKTEKEAAQIYDMMALHLYGEGARLNFNASDYSAERIEETRRRITAAKYTSIYRGVDFVTSLRCWRAVVSLPCSVKKTWVKKCQTEEEAAEAHDKAAIHFLKASSSDLNYPSKYGEYLKEDLAAFCYRPVKQTKYEGVTRHPNGKYRAKLRKNGVHYHCGYFDTEEKAYEAVQHKQALLTQ